MWDDGSSVAIRHWQPATGTRAIGAARDSVDAFAAAHGMASTLRADVRAAVSEAVADAVMRHGATDEEGAILIDAATDGAWLTVRVRDDATRRGRPSDGCLPLVRCLPHRLEWDVDECGTRLLMEFAMGAVGPACIAPRHGRVRRCRGMAATGTRRRR